MKNAKVAAAFLTLGLACLTHSTLAEEPARLKIRWTLTPCGSADQGGLDVAAGIIRARLGALSLASAVDLLDGAVIVKTAPVPEEIGMEDIAQILTARGGFALYDILVAALQDTLPPETYEIPAWARPPDPRAPRVFIAKDPGFTAVPDEPPVLREPETEWMKPSIHVPLSVEARQRLAAFTEERKGRMVGIVIDGKLWTVPTIHDRIFGDLYLEVDTTLAAARVLGALVAATPLDICLDVIDRVPIDEAYIPPAEAEPAGPTVEPAALELYKRFIDEVELSKRNPPSSARITMHAGILFDDEAVAEYLWQAPGRDRVRAEINAVDAWHTLESLFDFPMPATRVIEFLHKQAERQRIMLKGSGRVIIGVNVPGTNLLGLNLGLLGAVAFRPWDLIDHGQVDLLAPPMPDGEMLTIRGTGQGAYRGEEVRFIWLTGAPHVDSLVVLTPESDGRGRLEYITLGGRPLIERMTWSTGKPGDSERARAEMWFDYMETEGYWLTDAARLATDGDTTVIFEVLDAEVDIDLDGVDWSDSISVVRRDDLIEAQKGTEAEREQHLLDQMNEN
jgi:hypothetical protein